MIAHVDMNSYFASVEQQANPHWRGRPLGVCAYLHKHGCVIAASIEAKKRGAKVGMSVDECRQVCPDMVFVQNDPPKYRAVTSRVFSLLHQISDKVEHYSIDEAFLDLDGWYRDAAEAAWALCRTRIRIQREIGDWLKCSIGIAPSKFLAKLASDLKKPNGLVIITPENLDETLATLELEDACGIGRHIKRRLNRLGIYTLLDLKHYPVANLMQVLGKAGWTWHERLCGHDVDRLEVAGERLPKSVGHSFCVPRAKSVIARREFDDRRGNLLSSRYMSDEPARILAILIRLTERAGRRLRSFGLFARSMTVNIVIARSSTRPHRIRESVSGAATRQSTVDRHASYDFARDDRNESPTCSMTFGEPANDIFSLTHGATELLKSVWDGKRQVSFLAVTLNDLVPPSGQIILPLSVSASPRHLSPTDAGERKRSTSYAVDSIRDRYGDESIIFASMLKLGGDYAPDRIGFRKTEGVDVN